MLVEPYAVIDVFLQPHHFHVFLLYFGPPFHVPLPDLQTTSVHINILDFEIDMLYLCFWQPQPEKMKIVLIPPEAVEPFFVFMHLIQSVLNVECLAGKGGKCLAGLSRLYLVSQQPGQRMEFPLKKLNNLCKIMSYIQAFIK